MVNSSEYSGKIMGVEKRLFAHLCLCAFYNHTAVYIALLGALFRNFVDVMCTPPEAMPTGLLTPSYLPKGDAYSVLLLKVRRFDRLTGPLVIGLVLVFASGATITGDNSRAG